MFNGTYQHKDVVFTASSSKPVKLEATFSVHGDYFAVPSRRCVEDAPTVVGGPDECIIAAAMDTTVTTRSW